MSRNRARKIAYAAQANQGSRNQDAIDGPIIGRFELVTTEPITKVVADETSWSGERLIVVGHRPVAKPYQRIVHDGDATTAAPVRHREKSGSPKAVARRERAQARCAETNHRYKQRDASAIDGNRCGKCGAGVA